MRFAICVFTLIAAVAGPAAAGTLAGVSLPDTVTAGGKQLRLNGMGLKEATVLKVDIYVAGLYVESVSSDPARLLDSNETKLLVLRFVRDVNRRDIMKVLNDGFRYNATPSLAAIRAPMDQLLAWVHDLKRGQTLTFLHVPGDGVYVDVGNVRKGVLRGDEFARSLFAIWLGPRPTGAVVKQGLLGNH